MTKWAAYSCRLDERIGSLEVGKDANLTILSEDMMTAYERGLIANIMTVLDGKVVYTNGDIRTTSKID